MCCPGKEMHHMDHLVFRPHVTRVLWVLSSGIMHSPLDFHAQWYHRQKHTRHRLASTVGSRIPHTAHIDSVWDTMHCHGVITT